MRFISEMLLLIASLQLLSSAAGLMFPGIGLVHVTAGTLCPTTQTNFSLVDLATIGDDGQRSTSQVVDVVTLTSGSDKFMVAVGNDVLASEPPGPRAFVRWYIISNNVPSGNVLSGEYLPVGYTAVAIAADPSHRSVVIVGQMYNETTRSHNGFVWRAAYLGDSSLLYTIRASSRALPQEYVWAATIDIHDVDRSIYVGGRAVAGLSSSEPLNSQYDSSHVGFVVRIAANGTYLSRIQFLAGQANIAGIKAHISVSRSRVFVFGDMMGSIIVASTPVSGSTIGRLVRQGSTSTRVACVFRLHQNLSYDTLYEVPYGGPRVRAKSMDVEHDSGAVVALTESGIRIYNSTGFITNEEPIVVPYITGTQHSMISCRYDREASILIMGTTLVAGLTRTFMLRFNKTLSVTEIIPFPNTMGSDNAMGLYVDSINGALSQVWLCGETTGNNSDIQHNEQLAGWIYMTEVLNGCVETSSPVPATISTTVPLSWNPTTSPSTLPTLVPTRLPSQAPSNGPTGLPSILPSNSPTSKPTPVPTQSPSSTPTIVMSANSNSNDGNVGNGSIIGIVVGVICSCLLGLALVYWIRCGNKFQQNRNGSIQELHLTSDTTHGNWALANPAFQANANQDERYYSSFVPPVVVEKSTHGGHLLDDDNYVADMSNSSSMLDSECYVVNNIGSSFVNTTIGEQTYAIPVDPILYDQTYAVPMSAEPAQNNTYEYVEC